jgi:hypothetical protein
MNIACRRKVVIRCKECKELLNRDSHPRIYWKFNLGTGKIDAFCETCNVINEHYKEHEKRECACDCERERIPHIEYQ